VHSPYSRSILSRLLLRTRSQHS